MENNNVYGKPLSEVVIPTGYERTGEFRIPQNSLRPPYEGEYFVTFNEKIGLSGSLDEPHIILRKV